uniref:Uncharacterized protein n=1 Tax=Anguilla anguilla TaxID=7936 RepID=A0A0E9QJ03_ANGAN
MEGQFVLTICKTDFSSWTSLVKLSILLFVESTSIWTPEAAVLLLYQLLIRVFL